MTRHFRSRVASTPGRSVTIKEVAAELGLSITTISRALNGYSDVGEATRLRVVEAARAMGYHPNRNAQRLVMRRTHNIGWVQTDNDRKFVDPHFVEVMAGVLRGARAGNYDLVMSSATPDNALELYERFVRDNSVDGFVIDLPAENDPRITYLLEMQRPFVVHGRESRADRYGWIDIDNYGNFYRLTRLLIANGHRRIAFINGDEGFTYALYRRLGAMDALADAGLPPHAITMFNTSHPMGDAGFALTRQALADPDITAILYSSTLMAMEGHSLVTRSGRQPAIATMDDELHYLDLSLFAGQISVVRSSLREAGEMLIGELIRQCEGGGAPRGRMVPSHFQIVPALDATSLDAPVPARSDRPAT